MILLAILILATLVYAAPNPTITLTPLQPYESNSIVFNYTINNQFKNELITNIQIDMPSFNINDVIDFLGWDENFTTTQAIFSNGDIETNAIELFQINATANLVNSNQTININITTTGSGTTTSTLQITIVNDATSPILSNNIPVDQGFLRQGINNQQISIDAEDNETGIKNASFTYYDCTPNATNITINTITLTCSQGTCLNTADLSQYQEGERMCFNFTVYNNAEDATILSGDVGFDGTAPSVYLIAPANGTYGSNNTIFTFNATDNLAPNLTCDWIINNNIIDSATANNGAITSTTYDMSNVSEGSHEWKVRCSDWVNLTADSELRTIIIDKTAPLIVLNSPSNGSIISDGVMIDVSVTDNYEVDTVNYSISLNSTELPEGINTLIVNATDKAGNKASQIYTFIVDRTPPAINIISPADNASSDVPVSIIFNATDNLDPTLNCSLYLNNSEHQKQIVNSSAIINMSTIIAMADYSWHLVCTDDAGNAATTGSRLIHVTDITGPNIISNITYVARTEIYPFDVNVTDISGIDNVQITFNNTNLNLTNSGDFYSSNIVTDLTYPLGNYSITILANDTLGNNANYNDVFTLVQGYIISATLTPSNVDVGKEVIISGTVTLDDGQAVPENYTTLYLPEEKIDVNITNGTYTYTFNAPNSAGTYTVYAAVVSPEGFNHTASTQLTTVNPAGGGGSGNSGSSGSGGGMSCGDGTCQAFESCSSCSSDCGACPAEPENQNNQLGNNPVGGQEVNTTNNATNISQEPAQPREPSPGVGTASGWFRKVTSNPWVWAIFLVIVAGMYLMSTDSKKQKVDWKGYFDK